MIESVAQVFYILTDILPICSIYNWKIDVKKVSIHDCKFSYYPLSLSVFDLHFLKLLGMHTVTNIVFLLSGPSYHYASLVSLCFLLIITLSLSLLGFPGGSDGNTSACNVGDPGLIPGSGRSPGEGNGNPLQYSCLENPMPRGTWWATVHGITKSQTQLSDFTFFPLSYHNDLFLSISDTPWLEIPLV